MAEKEGYLGNNIVSTRVRNFGGRLWQSCVYSKFGYFNNIIMVSMAKRFLDKLSIWDAAYAHYD